MAEQNFSNNCEEKISESALSEQNSELNEERFVDNDVKDLSEDKNIKLSQLPNHKTNLIDATSQTENMQNTNDEIDLTPQNYKSSTHPVNNSDTDSSTNNELTSRNKSSSGGAKIVQSEVPSCSTISGGELRVNGNGSDKMTVDEQLAKRRRSFVPMSTMEEENFRERLHKAQLKNCSNIIYGDAKYAREAFRRMFQRKVRLQFLQ